MAYFTAITHFYSNHILISSFTQYAYFTQYGIFELLSIMIVIIGFILLSFFDIKELEHCSLLFSLKKFM